jgi:CRISPR/Cas system CMR subunit Cmr6 (Cas7 group RAMP superfamily)
LGTFATVNQWSVDNLIKQLDQNNPLIEQLQNDMQQMEVTFRDKINFDIDQIRQGFEKQIKQLQDKLEVSVQNQHLSNNMLSQ